MKGLMMPSVSVGHLKPGMKLSKALTRGAMVILGEGTVLTENWIARLQDMDVEKVSIEGPSEQPVPKAQALDALDARFRPVIDRPPMARLKKIVEEHIESLYAQ